MIKYELRFITYRGVFFFIPTFYLYGDVIHKESTLIDRTMFGFAFGTLELRLIRIKIVDKNNRGIL